MRPRRRRARSALLVALLLLAACGRGPARRPAPASAPASAPAIDDSATLLGGERGLDHVGIAVTDLELARHTYEDRLGFRRPVTGHLPNGIDNVNFYFGDATYLETLVHYDRQKASWLAEFTDRHSGALFLVLAVHSPEGTTAFLRRRGIAVSAPVAGTIQTAGEATMPPPKWHTLFLKQPLVPGDAAYFIAYRRHDRDELLARLKQPAVRRIFRHENSALGTASVWFGVKDLEAATRAFETLGLARRGGPFADARVGARGQEIEAGQGTLRLLAPDGPDSRVAAFLKERGGEGLMGVTLEAHSVAKAARVIGAGTARTFTPYAGLIGACILVPPELTLGVWLELCERPGRPQRPGAAGSPASGPAAALGP